MDRLSSEAFRDSDGYSDADNVRTSDISIDQSADRPVASATDHHAKEERYRYTIALSPMISWVADQHGGVVDVDQRGLSLTGLTLEEAQGDGFFAAIHPEDRRRASDAWRANRTAGTPLDYEVRFRTSDDSYRWHRVRAAARRKAAGNILCWYGTIEDIDDRKTADDAVRWAAEHDDLTGLANRRAFRNALRQAIDAAGKDDAQVALLLFDIDRFKQLNDQFGHDAGDALLREVAARLANVDADQSMSGRMGGDEFALFLACADRASLDEVIARVLCGLAVPLRRNGQLHDCRISAGIAIYPAHGDVAAVLYKNADLALYEAKSAGGGARIFENAMRARSQHRLSALSLARHALEADDIVPHYQPKIDLASRKVVGFESLLRWKHAGKIHPPGLIHAAFDDAELSGMLGQRMVDRTLADMRRWMEHAVSFGRIALNVSAAEFRRDDYADRLLERLRLNDIPGSLLELEVTEQVLLDRDADGVRSMFETLRAEGVTIALDDFGTGHASLVHLTRFPIDTIKIDQSFVQNLADRKGAAIVRAIIGLGRGLAITTVAEGVESAEQASRLQKKGCDLAQGFLFSPAIPGSHVPTWLSVYRGLAPGELPISGERNAN